VNSLFAEFEGLPRAATATEFTAIPISASRRDFLAKSEDGSPVFLLHDSSPAHFNPGINFHHLSSQFHATCGVHTGAGRVEDQFCIVTCDASVPELHELFVRCVCAAIEELPAACSTRELEQCISRLRDLFRALSQPSGREIAGLWAELFVIERSNSYASATAAWRDDQLDRYDFSGDMMRAEVKSSTKGFRSHEFGLEQLQQPEHSDGFVVSVMMQTLAGGAGVLDLASSIDEKLGGYPKLRQKLWRNVAQVLGAEFSERVDKRFDVDFSIRNLVVFAMMDIPRPVSPSDPRISSVRFIADLSTVRSSLQGTPSECLVRLFKRLQPLQVSTMSGTE
jgi:hypothetical protein